MLQPAELSSCNSLSGPQSLKELLADSLQKVCSLTPGWTHWDSPPGWTESLILITGCERGGRGMVAGLAAKPSSRPLPLRARSSEGAEARPAPPHLPNQNLPSDRICEVCTCRIEG